jgi:titin
VISGNTGSYAATGIGVGIGGTQITVAGNYIGTDASGSKAVSNGRGVVLGSGASNNTIGGTTSGARNVISGNTSSGVAFGSTGNVVEGNYIGTDATGSQALGNGSDGSAAVVLATFQGRQALPSINDTIGGTTSGAANVISGNFADGIRIVSNNAQTTTLGNTITGNLLGTDATGTRALGNGRNGVVIANNSARDRIASNVIAHNGQSGILVGLSSSDTLIHEALSRNALFANAGLGIDLAPQGSVNCTTSPPGPNDYTPCPVISSATTTQVRGTACAHCTVEVFIASNEADDQGHGEGQTLLGSVSADAAGNWSLTLSAGQVAAGQRVTATATMAATPAETSEFAANVVVAS